MCNISVGWWNYQVSLLEKKTSSTWVHPDRPPNDLIPVIWRKVQQFFVLRNCNFWIGTSPKPVDSGLVAHEGDPGSYSGYSAHCWLRLPSCVSLDYTDTSCVLTSQAIVVSLLTTQTQAVSLCVSSFCIRSCTPQGGKWSSVMPRSDKIEDWENDGEEVLNVPYLGFKNPLIPSAAHFFWAPSLFGQLQMPTGGCCFHECLL